MKRFLNLLVVLGTFIIDWVVFIFAGCAIIAAIGITTTIGQFGFWIVFALAWGATVSKVVSAVAAWLKAKINGEIDSEEAVGEFA